MADDDYLMKLDQWHLELAILSRALSHEFSQVDDENQSAVFHVLGGQLSHLVESCPFPAVSIKI